MDDIIAILKKDVAFNNESIESIDSCKEKVTEFFSCIVGKIMDATTTFELNKNNNEISRMVIGILGDNICKQLVTLFKETHSMLRDTEGEIINDQVTNIFNIPNYLK